jgi:hypothetical protein
VEYIHLSQDYWTAFVVEAITAKASREEGLVLNDTALIIIRTSWKTQFHAVKRVATG